MKIGIYDPYLDDIGGGEKYMLSIAEALSMGNDVSVFWNNKEDFENVKKRFSLRLSNVRIEKNIFGKNVSFWERYKISREYDVLIVLSDGSIPLVSSRLLIHLQRPVPHIRLSILSRIKKARVKTFFCNSYYTKSFIDKSFKINSKVIYPPITISARKLKKENIILHVGRFRIMDKEHEVRDFKKQYMLLQVFKQLVDQGLTGWTLYMVVSVRKEDLDIFHEIVQNYKKYPIEFKINKGNYDLWNYYSQAKIYWHASGYGEDLVKNPEYAEHFGISTVEAMGAGVVPVVISAGGQKEIVEDGVNGFTWSSEEEFKEKTMNLIKSKNLLDQMSAKAIIRSKDFTYDSFAKKIIEMVGRK